MVPKLTHVRDFAELLGHFKGEDLARRFELCGIDDLHMLTLMTTMFINRTESHIPILALALGIDAPGPSYDALLGLMGRLFVRATWALKHQSCEWHLLTPSSGLTQLPVVARVIFQAQLADRVQRHLWRMESLCPTPKLSIESLVPGTAKVEELVAAKIVSMRTDDPFWG